MVGDTSLITVAIDAMGRATAEQRYGADLVSREARTTPAGAGTTR
jgi:hypothetical protein